MVNENIPRSRTYQTKVSDEELAELMANRARKRTEKRKAGAAEPNTTTNPKDGSQARAMDETEQSQEVDYGGGLRATRQFDTASKAPPGTINNPGIAEHYRYSDAVYARHGRL